MKVFVIGGAGYIGSHVCKALKAAGFIPIAFDNLINGHEWAVKWGPLITGDVLDSSALDTALLKHQPQAVIHLASHIDVRESMTNPLKYYQNNVVGTFTLLQAMKRHHIDKIVFSSTAAVYGHPVKVPIEENQPCQPINVYGKTKWMAEEMIRDCQLKSVMLRYFNAAGADASAEIGEAHTPETHLIPLAIQAALGKTGGKNSFKLFGTDHSTPDGTPIRDFIHVVDLAEAHVQALQWLLQRDLQGGTQATLNLGSGKGHSVAEVIAMIEKKIGRAVPHEVIDRNPSDPPALVASIAKAQEILNWTPKQSDLETIISSAIEWHKR